MEPLETDLKVHFINARLILPKMNRTALALLKVFNLNKKNGKNFNVYRFYSPFNWIKFFKTEPFKN